MGMDGVNNAVIPGKATPEDYVAEITRANEGIINQRTVYQTASRGYDMVRRLERYGVKFAKDAHGDYDVRRVHRSGSYVLPMPEGKDIKKVLYGQAPDPVLQADDIIFLPSSALKDAIKSGGLGTLLGVASLLVASLRY